MSHSLPLNVLLYSVHSSRVLVQALVVAVLHVQQIASSLPAQTADRQTYCIDRDIYMNRFGQPSYSVNINLCCCQSQQNAAICCILCGFQLGVLNIIIVSHGLCHRL